jgi:hypothetical protein
LTPERGSAGQRLHPDRADIDRDGLGPSRWPLDRAPLPLGTSIPGVFAAGDARYRSIKRVASAVGDGATAVRMAHEYLAAGYARDERRYLPTLQVREFAAAEPGPDCLSPLAGLVTAGHVRERGRGSA